VRDSFIKALTALAKKNSRIFLVTGDLGFRVFDEFAAALPSQFLNAGVAEQNMTGMAAGLAMEGRIVFTYSIGNFPVLRPMEQIRNDICYHRANVIIVSVGGGLSYGSLGVSHHATEDLSVMRAMPHMRVVVPGTSWEAGEAVESLAYGGGPAYLRLDKSSMPEPFGAEMPFELGKSRQIREGTDVTLIATVCILTEAVAAAEALACDGISSRVLSMHTVKPLDRQAVLSAALETGGIVTVEEHSVDGGLGGAVAEVCLESGIVPEFFYRIGMRDGFSSRVGSQAYLRSCYGMDGKAIAAVAMECVKRRRPVTCGYAGQRKIADETIV